MIKRTLLFAVITFGLAFSSIAAFADPIVELAAPRIRPKIIDDAGSGPIKPRFSDSDNTKKTISSKKSKNLSSKHKKHAHKKAPVFKIDYDKVSRLIENGFYDDADRILQNGIHRNPKDIKAQALYTISLAKQSRLDSAQLELNKLLKQNSNNSNLHYAQGIVYYQRTTSSNMLYRANAQKYLNDSMNEFKKAFSLDKNNARAYNAAGVISIKLGNNNDANNYFKKAVTLDKTYSMAIDNLGTMDFIAGKYSDAEKKFKNALAYNSQNTTAMYHMAQVSMQKKDYNSAILFLNNALYLNPSSPAIYNLLGRAYLIQGNQAAAINSFNKSIAITPEFTLSYLDLADIYEQRGDCELAIDKLKTVLSINPDCNDAKLKLANISLDSGKYKQAIDTYLSLVGVDGYNDSALIGLANTYYGQAKISVHSAIGSKKDAFKALEYIDSAIKANPNDLDLHLAKLKLSKYLNKPEETKIELNKIVNSPENNLASKIAKGEAYITLNDYKNAKIEFDSAAKLAKTFDEDLYVSEILLFNKQYDSAKTLLDKILKYDPKNQQAIVGLDYIKKNQQNAQVYYKSALIFAKQKNIPTAIEYLNKSINSDPNNAESHLLLGELYEKIKNYDAAVNSYRAFVSLAPTNVDTRKIIKKINQLDKKL